MNPPNNKSISDLLAPPATPRRRRLSDGASQVFHNIINRPRSSSDAASITESRDSDSEERSDELGMYYSHLHKHVREATKKRTDLMPPEQKDFEFMSDGQLRTDWMEYITAWVKYIIQSAASDRVDEQLEPFSLVIVKSGVDRLYSLAEPLMEPARKLYLILWHYDLLLAFAFVWSAGFIIWIRLDSFVQLTDEALDMPSFSSQQEPNMAKIGQFWRRIRPDAHRHHHHQGFSVLAKKSVFEWRADIKHKYGPKGQLLLLDIVDILERVKK
ncbi:hypothetical protein EC973_008846 [Apophysomyces ossiformis]|uniref:Uncharacterized protein n=1 Tax=Apophysomyces ossiformis TaxID=679940 RepID=A0A8H7C0H7_9FUNG|nr:hypothetical protein EC973_008846 [Apophysomyces ossiformis]